METADPGLATQGETEMGRRRFLRYVLSFSVLSTIAMVLTPVLGFLVPSKTTTSGVGGKVLAGSLADIAVGKGKVVPFGGKPAIVLNTDQGIRAYSAICTHLGCIVAWDETARLIVCPCHDGRFTPTTGSVVSGPPPAPLPPITAQVEGDQIFLLTS